MSALTEDIAEGSTRTERVELDAAGTYAGREEEAKRFVAMFTNPQQRW
jgi:hypothetical protein